MKISAIQVSLAFSLLCAGLAQASDSILKTVIPQEKWMSDYNKNNRPSTATDAAHSKDQKKKEIKYISVHNFECPKEDELQELNNIWNGHVKKGWGDIAYHYIVSDTAKVYQGRKTSQAPASGTYYLNSEELASKVASVSKGQVIPTWEFTRWSKERKPGNTQGHITVSLLCGGRRIKVDGKNRMVEHPETLSEKAMGVVADLVAELLVEYKLTPDDVRAHREVANSNCPNDRVYKWLRGDSMKKDGEGEGLKQIRKRYNELLKAKG